MLIPGTVKSIHSRFGIFVELPSGLVGLAPNRVSFSEHYYVVLGTREFNLLYLWYHYIHVCTKKVLLYKETTETNILYFCFYVPHTLNFPFLSFLMKIINLHTLYDAEFLLQFVSDRQWQKAKEQYHIGQAVIARILQSNRDDNKCLVSLRMQECYQGNTEVDLVEDYLMALDKIGMHNVGRCFLLSESMFTWHLGTCF